MKAKNKAIRGTVALVLGNLALGGAERQALELARRLPSYGWRAIIIISEDRGELRKDARAVGVPVYALGTEHWRRKWSPLFWTNLLGAIMRLATTLRRERCLIVQSYFFWQDILCVPASWLAPCVKRLISLRRNAGVIMDHRPHYRVLQALANIFADSIVCNSRSVRRDTLRRERFVRGKLGVIPNGVREITKVEDARELLVDQYPVLCDVKPLIGMVATLKPQKRHDVFLKALHQARKKCPQMKAILVGNDLGMRARLESMVRELMLENAVVFTGGLKDPGVVFSGIDVFALTSDYEGMPNALLEAMAAGLPVVATRVTGTEEVVADRKTGMLCEAGDDVGIANAMVELARDRSVAKKMGEAARRFVLNKYGMNKMVSRYARLYHSLLSNSS